MPKESSALDEVFHALSDPTRRAVIQRLSLGPATVSELARPFDMALPSFVQHLQVLEHSGLVHTLKVGRVRTCHITPETLSLAEQWLAERRDVWEGRLDRLEDYLGQLQTQGQSESATEQQEKQKEQDEHEHK
jgi:DNA-binding transcriptional ArsR family regulator